MSKGLPIPAAQRGKIAPQLAHVVFRTPQPEKLVQWYCDVLEAQVSMGNAMVYFLTYDEEHHRIAIARLPGLTEHQPMAIGFDHVAFTYASPDELFATYERLKSIGIEPYWTINHGPTISFYYNDPDGNHVELQFDIQENAAAANEWFEQSDFDVNPIGVKVDAEDLISRYRAGEDTAKLFARPVISPDLVMAQFPAPLEG